MLTVVMQITNCAFLWFSGKKHPLVLMIIMARYTAANEINNGDERGLSTGEAERVYSA
jgi:hypothetical protein